MTLPDRLEAEAVAIEHPHPVRRSEVVRLLRLAARKIREHDRPAQPGLFGGGR